MALGAANYRSGRDSQPLGKARETPSIRAVGPTTATAAVRGVLPATVSSPAHRRSSVPGRVSAAGRPRLPDIKQHVQVFPPRMAGDADVSDQPDTPEAADAARAELPRIGHLRDGGELRSVIRGGGSSAGRGRNPASMASLGRRSNETRHVGDRRGNTEAARRAALNSRFSHRTVGRSATVQQATIQVSARLLGPGFSGALDHHLGDVRHVLRGLLQAHPRR